MATRGSAPGRLWSAQWAPLLDTLMTWGLLSGADLGVRVSTAADGLLADVVVRRQRAADVRFSTSLTNLIGFNLEQIPPSVTVAIVAGTGHVAARVRRAGLRVGSRPALGQAHRAVHRPTANKTDTTKLQQGATDEVANGAGTIALATDVADTPVAAYQADNSHGWDLGDRVTVHVGLPGGVTAATVVDLVREIDLEVTGSGAEKITPAVGTSEAKALRPGPARQALARVAARLTRLTVNK